MGGMAYVLKVEFSVVGFLAEFFESFELVREERDLQVFAFGDIEAFHV